MHRRVGTHRFHLRDLCYNHWVTNSPCHPSLEDHVQAEVKVVTITKVYSKTGLHKVAALPCVTMCLGP